MGTFQQPTQSPNAPLPEELKEAVAANHLTAIQICGVLLSPIFRAIQKKTATTSPSKINTFTSPYRGPRFMAEIPSQTSTQSSQTSCCYGKFSITMPQ
jgi:hypothetical protein